MANSLTCVPDDVTLRCGARTTIRVKTSDGAQGVTIKALGYDSTVASLNPAQGNTNDEGYLEVSVTCAQERACPGETTVTFDAKGYNEDTLNIECETFDSSAVTTAKIAVMELPLKKLPKLLSEQIFSSSTSVQPRDCSCKSIDILMPKVELGVTPLGEVYNAKSLQIIAYLDSTASVAYISETDRQRARELLQVSGDDQKWLIRRDKKLTEFKILPLSDLNLAQPIQRDDGGILKGWTCREMPGGACVNIFYIDDKSFAFSMKLPDYGMVMCRPYPDAECQFFWHTLEYDIYKAADCAGPSVKETLQMALCHLT